jgi:hypothetical protein
MTADERRAYDRSNSLADLAARIKNEHEAVGRAVRGALTASHYMRLAKRLPKSANVADLSVTEALDLLAPPPADLLDPLGLGPETRQRACESWPVVRSACADCGLNRSPPVSGTWRRVRCGRRPGRAVTRGGTNFQGRKFFASVVLRSAWAERSRIVTLPMRLS